MDLRKETRYMSKTIDESEVRAVIKVIEEIKSGKLVRFETREYIITPKDRITNLIPVMEDQKL